MRKDVQRKPKSRDQSKRKHTQHNMIEQAKSSVCLAKKAKSSRPDVVHTHPDGMLSNKRSIEPSASRRMNMSVQTLHTRSLKTYGNMQNFFFPNVSFKTSMYK
jgi:hypothetical protein